MAFLATNHPLEILVDPQFIYDSLDPFHDQYRSYRAQKWSKTSFQSQERCVSYGHMPSHAVTYRLVKYQAISWRSKFTVWRYSSRTVYKLKNVDLSKLSLLSQKMFRYEL